MARVRSPNYPQLSLPQAVERVAAIFAKEHQHATPRQVVASHLGYGGLNGASLGAISALLKYGLLEKVDDDYKVSGRFLSIVHPGSESEKRDALREAATAPALFSELLDHFEGRLPSDENLKSYLIRRGFSQNAITGVISTLRETVEYVSLEQTAAAKAPPLRIETSVQTLPTTKDLAPRAARGPSVSVTLEDDLLHITATLGDQKGIVKLIQILEANKVLLPVDAEKVTGGDQDGHIPSGREE